jgi:hypothetical protein
MELVMTWRAMMIGFVVSAAGLSCASHPAPLHPAPLHPAKMKSVERGLLQDWALSRCLAKATKDEVTRDDAAKTAAALLERGNVGIATYERLEQLVDGFLARTYGGSLEANYNTLKCIDLYHSSDLAQALDHID